MQPRIRTNQFTNENAFTRTIEGSNKATLNLQTTGVNGRTQGWSFRSHHGQLDVVAYDDKRHDISTVLSIAEDLSTTTITTQQVHLRAYRNPKIRLYNAAGAPNNKLWDVGVRDNCLNLVVLTDSESKSTTWCSVERNEQIVSAIHLVSDKLTHNNNEIITEEKGTFDGTFIGLTEKIKQPISYTKIGDQVTLLVPTTAGVSNASVFTIDGVPANLQITPAGNTHQATAISSGTNNGSTTFVCARFRESTDEIVLVDIFNKWEPFGVKGIDGFSITYLVRDD